MTHAALKKQIAAEIDQLMARLSEAEAEERKALLSRLHDYERAGKFSHPMLIAMAEDANPTIAMYGISALGREGSEEALRTLLQMGEARHAAPRISGNLLLLETVVDALGTIQRKEAAPFLLRLLGLKSTLHPRRLLRRRKGRREEQEISAERARRHLILPVLKALYPIANTRLSRKVLPLLHDPEPLVRWHILQFLVKGGYHQELPQIEKLQDQDQSPLVREAAQLAAEKLQALRVTLH